MRLDDTLYTAFLEEMQEIEAFRSSYPNPHDCSPLSNEDPETKRLIEAFAFFSARTRLSNTRSISATHRRIFEQSFPYLLSPLASMGILRCQATRQFCNPLKLEAGTEFLIGENGALQNLSPLEVFPLEEQSAHLELRERSGYRLYINIQARFTQQEAPKVLSFYLNILNQYHPSRRLQYLLEKHLEHAYIFFDNKEVEAHSCELTFSTPPAFHKESHALLLNPLEQLRLQLHFPEQDLYLNAAIPSPTQGWKRITLALDLDAQWPSSQKINSDMFQLFTTPVINLCKDFAQPQICDGTKERYAIYHPSAEKHFFLHSVRGVYRVEKKGLAPLRAGIIPDNEGNYELEYDQQAKLTWLTLNLPNAFETPQTISIEALWQQELQKEQSLCRLAHRHISGLTFQLEGGLSPNESRPLKENQLLQILAIKQKECLDLQDIICLLQMLKDLRHSHFFFIIPLLTDVRVEKTPSMQSGQLAYLYHYHLQFNACDEKELPILTHFLKLLYKLIDNWISDAYLKISASVPPNHIHLPVRS